MIPAPEPNVADWIAFRFRLTPCEARIVSALYQAKTWVSLAALAERAGMTTDSAKVHVANIRRSHGPNAILGYYGRGYTLGAEGVAVIRKALP